jgi:hypothetical protein
MFWAFLALLGTIALAVVYLLIWPFRMLIRKMRGGSPPATSDAASNNTVEKSTDSPAASR